MIQPTDKFLKSHPFIERMEGGLTDDPADAGGLTNHGVCMAFLSDLAKREPETVKACGVSLPVTRDTIRAMTLEQAQRLFYSQMWLPAHCEDLPLPVALCVYDMAVNHGVRGAVRIAQRAANAVGQGLIVDGVLGPHTLDALCRMGTMDGISALGSAREDYYRSIILRKPSQKVFERGWMRRARAMVQEAFRLMDVD